MDSHESEVKFKLRDERAGCYGGFAERGEEVIKPGFVCDVDRGIGRFPVGGQGEIADGRVRKYQSVPSRERLPGTPFVARIGVVLAQAAAG